MTGSIPWSPGISGSLEAAFEVLGGAPDRTQLVIAQRALATPLAWFGPRHAARTIGCAEIVGAAGVPVQDFARVCEHVVAHAQ
jgi:hypothetical protein